MNIDVVIPVYNKRNYVIECLETVRKQTYPNINVFIVDDGSEDKSSEIIQDYLNSYPSFKARLLRKENGGLSSARNYAFQYLSGDYVFFLDPDDMLPLDAVEQLVKCSEGNDIVVGRYRYFFSDEHTEDQVVSSFHKLNQNYCESDIDILYKYMIGEKYGINACNKLYSLLFLKHCGVLFQDNNEIYAEDLLFNSKLLGFNPDIRIVDEITYIYRQNEASITHTYQNRMAERYANLTCDYSNYSLQVKGMLALIICQGINCIGGQEKGYRKIKKELSVYKNRTKRIACKLKVGTVKKISSISHKIDYAMIISMYKRSVTLLSFYQMLKNIFLRKI